VNAYENQIDIFTAVFAEFESDRTVLEVFQEKSAEQSLL
jgi:hypothetical protein